MNRLKILYIHHGKGLGGAPISLLTLIKGLDVSRYRPIVLFLYDSEALQLFRDEGIEVIGPINLSDFSHTQIYWFRWYHLHHALKAFCQTLYTRWITAPKILKKINPTLIHLNTSSLIAWGIAASRLNIPVVWHIRESLADGYLGLRKIIIKKIIACYATRIVPICKTDGRFWSTTKKKVLYNPVDTQRFSPAVVAAVLPLNTPYLLFVGGLSYQKGTGFMLEIFEAVNKHIPSVRLIIAGAFSKPNNSFIQKFSPEKKYILDAYKRYEKLKNSIIVTGPTREIPALMKAASIIFFPAQVDHFARPVIEAGCMAKAVLASDLPQLREIIEHNVTGYLLAKDDLRGWVTTTIDLLTNEQKRSCIEKAHYTYSKKHFAQDEYSASIDALYEDVLTKKQLPIDPNRKNIREKQNIL